LVNILKLAMKKPNLNRFTDAKIRGLRKPEKRTILFEEGSGFGLRLEPSGRKSFILFYWFNGKKDGVTLGQYPKLSLADAHLKVAEIKKKIEKGEDPKVEIKEAQRASRNFYTVKDLCDEYITRYARVNKKSWKEDERCLNMEVVSTWGRRKAQDITRRDIVGLLDKIVDRGSPVTANRTLAVIRTMFNFAIKRAILDKSPCVLIEKPFKEKPRKRVLREEEITIFWKCLEKANMTDKIKLVLRLLLITGQRRGEVVNAEWCEVDLIKGWWTIPASKTKNGRLHRVPLSNPALKILESVKILSGDSAYLFPSPLGDSHVTERSVSRAVRNNEVLFNIPHFTPHDLRRTVASTMPEINIPQFIVSKILNHVEGGITDKVYDHYAYDKEKKGALTKWGKKVEKICGGIQ